MNTCKNLAQTRVEGQKKTQFLMGAEIDSQHRIENGFVDLFRRDFYLKCRLHV